MTQKIEVLAPAGNFEIMKAAFKAGADAVYIGGNKFGARAFADNAAEDQILEAIDYAHLHGKKLYLTVNTLLKNEEIEKELKDYLDPYYRQGLDAVIVQDPGVFNFVKIHYPEMGIHCSTQMTVCGTDYARFLSEAGATRIVTPRELLTDEIAEIKKASGVEIETFVHGALCYCYSGQCLMSSMIGGRSGNRGRCAQPCRLPYSFEKDGKKTSGCLLSPKDLCSLDILPELIEAGVDSLKIEGRMKKAEYAAFTAAVYRKYVDLYLEKGPKAYHVEEKDREKLMDLYNRGGFTEGYFSQHNGRQMMTIERPNHSGLCIGKVIGQKKNQLLIRLTKDVKKGDVLEMPDGKSEKLDADMAAGATLKVKYNGKFKENQRIMRTRNETLIQEISGLYVKNSEIKEKVYGFIRISKDSPTILEVNDGVHFVQVQGECAQEAVKQPLTSDELIKRLKKTGQTPFEFDSVEAVIEGDVFMPVQVINQLRREALEKLQEMILSEYRRDNYIPEKIDLPENEKQESFKGISVLVSREEQLGSVLKYAEVKRIYANLEKNEDFIDRMARLAKEAGKEFYIATPHIMREKTKNDFIASLGKIDMSRVDGFLIRNMEAGLLLKDSGKKMTADYQLYCMNDRAAEQYGRLYDQMTVPLELNRKEIMNTAKNMPKEMIVYGYLPVMVSAQCLTKTCGKCTGKETVDLMTDRMGKKLKVRNVCSYCYNLIYNTVPFYMPEAVKDNYSGKMLESIRIQLLDEAVGETDAILQGIIQLSKGKDTSYEPSEFTKGHYKRGVE